MVTLLRIVLAAALTLLPHGGAAAQTRPVFGLQVDQDVFFAPADDKDYTMGVQFDHPDVGWAAGVAGGMDPLSRFVLGGGVHEAASVHWGVSAFTPLKGPNGRILAASQPFPDDRPYASLLFGKVRRIRWADRNAVTSELTAGVLGLGIAEATQTWIHENVSDDVHPGGWHNQISDDFSLRSLTGAYRLHYQRLLAGDSGVGYDTPGFPGDVSVGVEAMAGYYTMARVGVVGRLGWVRSPWPSMGSLLSGPAPELYRVASGAPDPSRSGSRAASMTRSSLPGTPAAPGSCWCGLIPEEGFAWIRLGRQEWLYNALLQGQGDPADPVTLSYDPESAAPLESGVNDVSLGVAVRWARFGVNWTVVTWHSPLFGGPKSRNHEWGSLHLTYYQR